MSEGTKIKMDMKKVHFTPEQAQQSIQRHNKKDDGG
jgi:hypothetical protein